MIPNFDLTAPICETGDLVLYRATRPKDGLPILLKVPAAPRPTPILLRRLENEYELARHLGRPPALHGPRTDRPDELLDRFP